MIKRPFAIDFLTTFSSSTLGFLFSTVASILIARAVGPEGKGILALMSLASGQAVAVLALGIESAIVYYVGSGRVDKQVASSTCFLLSFALGTLAAGFTVGILHFILKQVSFAIWILIYVSAALTPVSLYSMYLGVIVRMEGKIVELAGFGLIHHFLYTCAIIGCFFLARNIPAILAVGIVTNLVSMGVSWFFYAKWGYLPPKSYLASKKVAYRLISYGIKGHIGGIFKLLNYRLDMYIIGYLLPVAQVGIYSVAVAFSELLLMIPNAIGVVITQRAATRPWKEANDITATVTRLTIVVIALGCIVLALLGHILIPLLYGKAFADAVKAMLWLLPGIWFLAMWKTLLSDIGISRGYPLYRTYSSGVAVVATVAFDLLLIPRFGINGAAIASSIAYAMAALTILFLFCKTTGVRISELLLPRGDDILYVRASVAQARKSLGKMVKT